MNLALDRITDFAKELFTTAPFALNVRNTENAYRSSPGTREQTPLQRDSGSIGTTRSQK